MKFDNLRAFEKHLKSAFPDHMSPLYLVLSKSDFERKKACQGVIAQTGTVKSFYSNQVEDSFLELQSLSLFQSKRLIHLKGIESLTIDSHAKLIKTFKLLGGSIYLLLSGTSLAKNTKLYKSAEDYGVVLDIAEIKPWEKEKLLQQWVTEQFLERGKQIFHQTVLSFVKQIGLDQQQLLQEIEKLVCFVGERPSVTDADVAMVATNFPQQTIWQLGEALFKRDAKGAFSIFRSLQNGGGQPLALLRQIRSQFQTEFQVLCLLQAGQSVTEQFPYMRGMILNKHIELSKNYGIERFKRALIKIDETELALKDSGDSPEILMDLLIARLSQ